MNQPHTFQSSNLQSILDYNADTGDLTVQFVSGPIYRYTGVPFKAYLALKSADTPGKYFHSHIKPLYTGERVDSPNTGHQPNKVGSTQS